VADKSKSSSYQVRLAQQIDVLSIANILAISFYHKYPQWFYPLAVWSLSLDLGLRLLDPDPRYACLIATSNLDFEAIATLELSIRNIPSLNAVPYLNWQTSPQPYISNLAVHPQWRKQGIALKLLMAVEHKVRSWGFKSIYLHVMDSNLAAFNLYQGSGYKLYKLDPEFRLNPFARDQRLLLRKFL